MDATSFVFPLNKILYGRKTLEETNLGVKFIFGRWKYKLANTAPK